MTDNENDISLENVYNYFRKYPDQNPHPFLQVNTITKCKRFLKLLIEIK